MTDDTCQCPTCGRLHRSLGFGEPPSSISASAGGSGYARAGSGASGRNVITLTINPHVVAECLGLKGDHELLDRLTQAIAESIEHKP